MRKIVLWSVVFLIGASSFADVIRFDRFDRNHSTVGFRVPIMAGLSRVEGKFTNFDVSVSYDTEDVTKSTVVAVIRVESIDTGIDDRDVHLRTGDFFDAANHPEIRFESKRLERKGDGFVAHGILTIRGVSNPCSVAFQITGFNQQEDKAVVGISGSARLNRQDYGVAWKHKDVPGFVGDDVDVEIHLLSRLTPLAATTDQ